MNITVVGTGYVGLVSGTCFAEMGAEVTCIDTDKTKIDQLKNGIIPIWEKGLAELVIKNYQKKKLFFSTDISENFHKADIIFIAVGTPSNEDGSADLSHVLSVAENIGTILENYKVIVIKSTVPVGTCYKVKEKIAEVLRQHHKTVDFDVASNPEFLKEGTAINDALYPDRIVIGTESENAQKKLAQLYHPFVLNNHPIIFMDILSSEMTKYVANAMLATKISFINEMANICDRVGADINFVRKGIGADPRIGNKFIYPGVGFGGSCFPKDLRALLQTAKEYECSATLIDAVQQVNTLQKGVAFQKIADYFNHTLSGKKIAIWGLSFKPETDDIREATSLTLIQQLLREQAKVCVYDPVATDNVRKVFGDKIQYSSSAVEALHDADVLALITEWNEFRNPDFTQIAKLMRGKLIFDGRNIFLPEEVKSAGLDYIGIGRK